MSRTTRVAVVIFLLVATSLLVVATSLAQPPGPPERYTGIQVTCAEIPGEMWLTGQVLHIRGVVSTGWTFGHDYFAGQFTNHTDIDLNLVTFAGNAKGTILIEPDAYQGSWQGHFTGPILNGMYSGQSLDFGEGELAGLMDIAHIQQIDPATLPNNPCGGPPVSAFLVEGMIVER
jgi:hypothetical protein